MNTVLEEIKHRVRQTAIRVYDHKLRFDKRRQLQRHGYKALADVSQALSHAGAVCFADFGTLLGIVRNGAIMAHDLDIDFGVLRTSPSIERQVKDQLVAMGCRLWRSHSVSGTLAAESYHFPCGRGEGMLKFDINYYDVDDHHCRTWLFYRDPAQRYDGRELSVVELTYERFEKTQLVDIKDQKIPIPDNAENFLEQKYGAGWRQPDPNWIYWKSPAARQLPEREHYEKHF